VWVGVYGPLCEVEAEDGVWSCSCASLWGYVFVNARGDSSREPGGSYSWLRFVVFLVVQLLFGVAWMLYGFAFVLSYGLDESRQRDAPAEELAAWILIWGPAIVCLLWVFGWYLKVSGRFQAARTMRYAAAAGTVLWFAAHIDFSRYTQYGLF
jgi:uncharacterized membrane protein YphA (DoxX/SURF4 family)